MHSRVVAYNLWYVSLNPFAGLAVGRVLIAIISSFIIVLCVIMKRRQASKLIVATCVQLTILFTMVVVHVHIIFSLFVCLFVCLFQILKTYLKEM